MGSNYSRLKWNRDQFDGNRAGLAITKLRWDGKKISFPYLPLILTHRRPLEGGSDKGSR